MDTSITNGVKRKAPARSRHSDGAVDVDALLVAVDVDALLAVDVDGVLFSDATAPMRLADLLGVSGHDGEARMMVPTNAW